MIRKENIFDWFKALSAHKRVDYMCGLLRLCLPLELRFIGTVLEDLAKKDFHVLRDQEIKANQRAELSTNNPSSLDDQRLRAKIITTLALMNSTNSPCADVIFGILKQHFDNMLEYLQDGVNRVDIVLILTMAIHHPAFSFYQRIQLGQVLERVEGHIREMFGGDDSDGQNMVLQLQGQIADTTCRQSSPNSHHASVHQSEKVSVVDIKIIDVEMPQNRKDCVSYTVQTTWSDGEVTKVVLKYKQLHDLHFKTFQKFPEAKRKHVLIPVFPGKNAHKGESTSDLINSLNTYFSQLVKALPLIHNNDQLTDLLRQGSAESQPKSTSVLPSSAPVAADMLHNLQRITIQASQLPEDTKTEVADQPLGTASHSGRISNAQCSSDQPGVSCVATSPAGYHTSSPALSASHAGGNSSCSPSSGIIGGNPAAVSAVGKLQPVPYADQTYQLLHVLNLEEFYENLKDYPFQQVIHMSKEDFDKAGVPADVQAKLKSKLSQLKSADVNGMVDPTRVPVNETSLAFYQPYCHPSFAHMNHHHLQHCIPPAVFSAQSGQITLLPTPHSHAQPNDNSPVNSETSSPPPSPLLPPMTVLSLDQGQGHVIGHASGPSLQVISQLPAVFTNSVTASEAKLLKKSKDDLLDSLDSDDDRTAGHGQKAGTPKSQNHGRPHQTQSLPLINQAMVSLSPMEAVKLMGMPVSMSAPHTYPAFVTPGEVRSDDSQLSLLKIPVVPVAASPQVIPTNPVSVVNGYISDPPPFPPQGAPVSAPRSVLNARTYKSPQPAHTSLGVHSNVMNMPALDVPHQIQNLGKNSASASNMQLLQGGMPLHSYNMGPPVASSIPSSHVMGLNAVNLQGKSTLHLGHQPPFAPPLVPEGGSTYPRYMIAHPRGILTTVANSTAILVTTQSHSTGPPMTHSPSLLGATVSVDQAQAATHATDALDSGRSEGPDLTSPPPQSPAHKNAHAVIPQSNTSSTNSGTPSPPPVSLAVKQAITPDAQSGGRGPQVISLINGYVPPLIHHQLGHQPQQQYPNGIASEYGTFLRLQHHITPSLSPLVIGSIYPPHGLVVSPQAAAGTSLPVTTANPSHTSESGTGVISRKSICYNCGHTGHEVSNCSESRMETKSNTFHLKYSPSDPPA